jgi:hypothetical protein
MLSELFTVSDDSLGAGCSEALFRAEGGDVYLKFHVIRCWETALMKGKHHSIQPISASFSGVHNSC